MASFHPGVKSLISRIMKQQPSQKEVDKKTDIKELLKNTQGAENVNRYSMFKKSLQQKMKEKRERMRQEEEEEDKLDEEYHFEECSKEATDEADEENVDKDEEEDEEEEEESNEDGDGDGDNDSETSDTNFKLNLDDDDEVADEAKFFKTKPNKTKSSFNEIPASIPSNQLKSGSKIKIMSIADEFEQCEMEDQTQGKFNLFIESQTDLSASGNKNGLDELESLSFNYDNGNMSALNANESGVDEAAAADVGGGDKRKSCDAFVEPSSVVLNNNDNDDDVGEIDELAFLCSGKFKEPTQKSQYKKDNQLKKIESDEDSKTSMPDLKNDEKLDAGNDVIDVTANNDLYDANGEDDDDEVRVPIGGEVIEDDGDDDDDADENTNDNEEIVDKKKFKKKVRSEFFENEAELSGSEEADSDENYDGEPDDDNLIACSGDEDELPSDSELKNQLEHIYLKDQIDKDKRELRMIKEMYLKDGEMHQDKDFRKKQFRWKTMNDDKGVNPFSSDDEDEDEEDDDENGDEKKGNLNLSVSKKFKNLNSSDWRKNRHEREEFFSRKRKEGFESTDDEGESHNDENSSSSNSNSLSISNSKATSDLLKIGHTFLKSNKMSMPLKKIDENEKDDVVKKVTEKQTTSENVPNYSFLRKDKSYLSRLSNYVNKTLNTSEFVKGKGAKAMVFSSISHEEKEKMAEEGEEAKAIKSPGIIEPVPKRAKITPSNSTSIFNLL